MRPKEPWRITRRWAVSGIVLSAGMLASACSSSPASPGGASGTANQSPSQLVNSGLAQLKAGNDQTARTDFNAVLTTDPSNKSGDNKIAYFDLGVIDQSQGNVATSEAEYHAALNIDANYDPALYNLAVEEAVGNPLGAISLYRQVVANDPNDAEALYNLGLLLYQQGQVTEGRGYLTKALKLNPSYQKLLPAGVTP
jgi:Tfp pilus assembly protein PilF